MPVIKNQELIEKHAMKLYGCSNSRAVELNSGLSLRDKTSSSMAYLNQRGSASCRGISWEISFEEWLRIWVESGFFSKRGRGKNRYCMCRKNDVGPYKIGNVFIATVQENSRDGIEIARPAIVESIKNRQFDPIGRGRGWTYRTGHKSPYQVVLGRKYIGCFKRQEEAELAYRTARKNLYGLDF